MKDIIGENHHLFLTRSRKEDISLPRQMIYYKAYERYQGCTEIKKYLKETYNFSVNQSTIYHAWYKHRKAMLDLTAEEFYHMNKDTYNSVFEIMDRYAAYQLGMHIGEGEGYRVDIRRKAKQLIEKYEGVGGLRK